LGSYAASLAAVCLNHDAGFQASAFGGSFAERIESLRVALLQLRAGCLNDQGESEYFSACPEHPGQAGSFAIGGDA